MLGSAGSTQTVSISKGHKNPGLEFKEFGGMLPKDWRLGFSLTLPVILFLKLGKQIPLRDQLLQDAAWRRAGGQWKQGAGCREWAQTRANVVTLTDRCTGGLTALWCIQKARFLESQVHRRAGWFFPLNSLPNYPLLPLSPSPAPSGWQLCDRGQQVWAARKGLVRATPVSLTWVWPNQCRESLVPSHLRLLAFSCHASQVKPWWECISLTILWPWPFPPVTVSLKWLLVFIQVGESRAVFFLHFLLLKRLCLEQWH